MTMYPKHCNGNFSTNTMISMVFHVSIMIYHVFALSFRLRIASNYLDMNGSWKSLHLHMKFEQKSEKIADFLTLRNVFRSVSLLNL